MRKIIILFIGLVICLTACKKANDNSSIGNKMIGNWLVAGTTGLSDTTNGIVVEWGLYYVNKVGINANNTFSINQFSATTGTWKFNAVANTITFYSVFKDVGTTYRDTTQFNISIDANDIMTLQNSLFIFKHKRLN